MSTRPQPDSLLKLMVSLAHELGHHILFFYQSGQDLFIDDFKDTEIYSSIRNTQRSIYGSFQGCAAFAFMGMVTRQVVKENLVNFNIPLCQMLTNKYREGLANGLTVFRPEIMSPLGKLLLSGLIEIQDFLEQ